MTWLLNIIVRACTVYSQITHFYSSLFDHSLNCQCKIKCKSFVTFYCTLCEWARTIITTVLLYTRRYTHTHTLFSHIHKDADHGDGLSTLRTCVRTTEWELLVTNVRCSGRIERDDGQRSFHVTSNCMWGFPIHAKSFIRNRHRIFCIGLRLPGFVYICCVVSVWHFMHHCAVVHLFGYKLQCMLYQQRKTIYLGFMGFINLWTLWNYKNAHYILKVKPTFPLHCLFNWMLFHCNRYVSCVLGCPYEGAVSPAQVARVSILVSCSCRMSMQKCCI